MALKVYYDGACPVCSREIGYYRSRPGTHGFTWINVNACDPSALGPDLSREAAMARMHIRLADGTLVSGAAAFAAMWRSMPGFRWLGRLLGVQPFGLFAEIGYRGFLVMRKLWR
jgi:predicted DCC family thiol-disulfide oxidoreductase YuxK